MTITRKDYETVRALVRQNGLFHALKWEPVVGQVFARLDEQPEDMLAWREQLAKRRTSRRECIVLAAPTHVWARWDIQNRLRRHGVLK